MALEEKASIGVHDHGGLGAAGRVEKLSTSPWRGIGAASHPLDVETMLKNEDAGGG